MRARFVRAENVLKPSARPARFEGACGPAGAAVVATLVAALAPNSPATRGGLPTQGRVVRIGDSAVATWLEVLAALQNAVAAGATEVEVAVAQGDEPPQIYTLPLDADSGKLITATYPAPMLPLVLSPQNAVTTTLQTRNPFIAMPLSSFMTSSTSATWNAMPSSAARATWAAVVPRVIPAMRPRAY